MRSPDVAKQRGTMGAMIRDIRLAERKRDGQKEGLVSGEASQPRSVLYAEGRRRIETKARNLPIDRVCVGRWQALMMTRDDASGAKRGQLGPAQG